MKLVRIPRAGGEAVNNMLWWAFQEFQEGMSEFNVVDNSSPTLAQGIGLTKMQFASGELIFEDTFETFDLNKWVPEPNGAGHENEFQLNTDSAENCYAQDGLLHIRPTLCSENDLTERAKKRVRDSKLIRDKFYPIRSARISTKESFSFTYGVVEFKARTPSGDWLFPALWLMPRDADYGSWPTSGEIDVMESRGNKHLTDASGNLVGAQCVGSTLHWGPNKTLDRWNMSHFTKEDESCFSSQFHVYKLIWTPDRISFYIDEKENGVISPPKGGFWEMGHFTGSGVTDPWKKGTKSAPFDKEFHLIINLAVGGPSFFSDTFTNKGGKPWKNASPDAALEFWEGREQWQPTWNLPSDDSHFLIDYVRVWAL